MRHQRGVVRPDGAGCDIGAFEGEAARNLAPVADAGGPYEDVCQGRVLGILLEGSASFDPNAGDVLTYQWSTTCAGTITNPTAADTAAEFDCMPCLATVCEVSLTVTDQHGLSNTATEPVTVEIDTSCLTAPDTVHLVKLAAGSHSLVVSPWDTANPFAFVRAIGKGYVGPEELAPGADGAVHEQDLEEGLVVYTYVDDQP